MRTFLAILSIVLIAGRLTDGLRILGVFPLTGKSHWLTGERLLTSLAERGHKVDAITHFPMKEPPSNYRDISLKGSAPLVVNNLTASNISKVAKQDFKFMSEIAGHQICRLMDHPKLQELIRNPPKDPPYDLVIVELFMSPCYLAFGRHLNVPMVGLMASSFHGWVGYELGNPANPSFTPFLFTAYEQRMTFWERLMNTVLTNTITLQLNSYMEEQDLYLKKHFGINARIADLYDDLALVLVNSHYSLNGITQNTQSVVEVGGLHVKDDSKPLPADLQKWLDESTHGCIFFTFGSMVRIETFPEPLLRTFYKVFEKIAPVRVLMKVARQEDLLPGLPKNVMAKPWFPQVAVLKHKNTKAFITHGGLLGTQEAIFFGVPLIGIPLFGDQHTNVKITARKNVAINLGSLDNVTEETLSYAINTILYNETYQTNMKKLSQLFKDRPMSALDTAIYWIEYVSRHGKVLQSPAIHLTWWQMNLFDVYGFIIACFLLVLLVLILLLRKLKNRFFARTCRDKKIDKSSNSKKNK